MADDGDDAPGVPEWVVTYGDMMSLLLTFFIMLVSMSEVVAEEKYRAILDALQQYTGYKTGPVAPPGKSFPLNSLIKSMDTLGSFTNSKTEQGFNGTPTDAIDGNSVKVYHTGEGKKLKVGQSLPFSPESDSFSEDVQNQLVEIAKEIAGKPNKIEIRGHTSKDLPSNANTTTLSYNRAKNVLLFLKKQGIDSNRIRITAYGGLQPAHLTGDKKEVKHDRVEVFILDAFATEYVGPTKAVN